MCTGNLEGSGELPALLQSYKYRGTLVAELTEREARVTEQTVSMESWNTPLVLDVGRWEWVDGKNKQGLIAEL